MKCNTVSDNFCAILDEMNRTLNLTNLGRENVSYILILVIIFFISTSTVIDINLWPPAHLKLHIYENICRYVNPIVNWNRFVRLG